VNPSQTTLPQGIFSLEIGKISSVVVTGLGKYFQHGAQTALIDSGGGMGGRGGGWVGGVKQQVKYIIYLYSICLSGKSMAT
jgi:hypothetical protein